MNRKFMDFVFQKPAAFAQAKTLTLPEGAKRERPSSGQALVVWRSKKHAQPIIEKMPNCQFYSFNAPVIPPNVAEWK